ncbi:MAG TPA: hypothetical protein VGN97_08225 [Mesorhizobium sp.]|jgi:hypothetical protein|nr:hypothetical protein [Mesorhizobium sp.]
MGHQHLLTLPKSRDWQHVVGLLTSGAELSAIAAATARAAERSMIDAANDRTVRHSFFLLTQIPLAAKKQDFPAALKKLGLKVSDQPSLVEIGSAMMDAIDGWTARLGHCTDYGEIAQLSAVESLHAVAGQNLQSLFGADHIAVKKAIAQLAVPERFAYLARDFFSRVTRRHLNFYLHRELSAHVGEGRRFPTMADHRRFEEQLDQHCRETSRIIKEFAAAWFCKHVAEGGIDRELAGGFVFVASGKMRDELAQR